MISTPAAAGITKRRRDGGGGGGGGAVAVKRTDGTMVFNPDAELQIDAGDILIALGRPEDLRELDEVCASVEE